MLKWLPAAALLLLASPAVAQPAACGPTREVEAELARQYQARRIAAGEMTAGGAIVVYASKDGATWTALRTYLLAASGAATVYRALQNAPDQRPSPGGASLRFWAPGGFTHPSSFRHRTRIKVRQRWVYKVGEAAAGEVYTATIEGVAYP